jgi:Tol biopolymer transport system component
MQLLEYCRGEVQEGRVPMKRARNWALLTAVAVVATLFSTLDSADAVYPGANGKIAYTAIAPVPGFALPDIFVMEPDGSGQTNVTNTGSGSESQPVWSPDGRKIAYVRTGIWVMNADGSSQTQLTSSGAWPSWSPDGSKIAFEVSGQTLWVVNADGTGLTELFAPADRSVTQPVWSPTGDKIAYRGGSPVPDIWIVDADGTNPINLTNSPTSEQYPDWSPDGSRIVFWRRPASGAEQIWTMDANGSNQVNVSPTGAPYGSGAPIYPAWSPDGTRIVLRWGGIRTMDPDGSALSAVLVNGDLPDWQALQLPPPTTTTSSTSTTLVPTTTTSSTSTTLVPTTTTSSTSTTLVPTTTTSSTSTTLVPTTTTSSTSTTLVPTTTTSSTSTTSTMLPVTTTTTTTTSTSTTSTTVGPGGTDFFDEIALSNGALARLTGSLTCEVGRRFRIEVTLTQGDVVGERIATGDCTGEPVHFRMRVRGGGFVAGAAQIEGRIQVGTRGVRTIDATFAVNEEVFIQVPGGFAGAVANALLATGL